MILYFGPEKDDPALFEFLVYIRDAYRSYFDRPNIAADPGARTARIAGAPDAKLSARDIEAFMCLIEKTIIPLHDEEIAALVSEEKTFADKGFDTGHYTHLIAIHREKQEKVRQWMGEFRDRFEDRVEEIWMGSSRCRASRL